MIFIFVTKVHATLCLNIRVLSIIDRNCVNKMLVWPCPTSLFLHYCYVGNFPTNCSHW